MKHRSHTLVLLAAIACIGLYGCGNTTDATSPGSLDTSAPPAPEGISLVTTPESNDLTWTPSAAADVAMYQVFEYNPDPSRDNAYVMIGESTTSSYDLGRTSEATNSYYRVRAVDASGNRSSLSAEYSAYLQAVGSGKTSGSDTGDNSDNGDSRVKLEE